MDLSWRVTHCMKREWKQRVKTGHPKLPYLREDFQNRKWIMTTFAYNRDPSDKQQPADYQKAFEKKVCLRSIKNGRKLVTVGWLVGVEGTQHSSLIPGSDAARMHPTAIMSCILPGWGAGAEEPTAWSPWSSFSPAHGLAGSRDMHWCT